MKTISITVLFIVALIGQCRAGVAVTPEIPVPKLTVSEVLAIAQTKVHASTNAPVLVAVDWYKASDFQPRFNDGMTYTPGDDDPNDYSWFVTYLYKNDDMEKHMNLKGRFNTVLVLRIKDDGQKGRFGGGRT